MHPYLGEVCPQGLVSHTGAVLDAGMNEMRSFQKGRPLFWANGQAGLWRKMGLTEVTEVPIVAQRAAARGNCRL